MQTGKTPRTIWLFAITLIALVAVGAYGFSTLSRPLTGSNLTPSTGELHVGYVAVSPVRHWNSLTNSYVEPASVLTQVKDENHNTFTNMGKNATRDALFHMTTMVPFSVVSTGIVNYSQVATDICMDYANSASNICTDWNANGLQPATGTVHDVTGSLSDFGNVSVTYTFTCTSCSSTVVNGTGLYNSTTLSNKDLFAEANFTSATLSTNDQINVTWFIWTS